MPGATSLGITYPLQGETVDADAWQQMATDIDGLLTQLDTLRDAARIRPSALISGGTTAGVASGVDTVLSGFTDEEWDTGGYANLGTSNDRLTLPPGIFWAQVEASCDGTTDIAMALVGVLLDGVLFGVQKMDNLDAGLNPGLLSTALVYNAVNGASLQARCRWDGTGTANFIGQRMGVYKIRDLVDV